jgi:hypothetical protein
MKNVERIGFNPSTNNAAGVSSPTPTLSENGWGYGDLPDSGNFNYLFEGASLVADYVRDRVVPEAPSFQELVGGASYDPASLDTDTVMYQRGHGVVFVKGDAPYGEMGRSVQVFATDVTPGETSFGFDGQCMYTNEATYDMSGGNRLNIPVTGTELVRAFDGVNGVFAATYSFPSTASTPSVYSGRGGAVALSTMSKDRDDNNYQWASINGGIAAVSSTGSVSISYFGTAVTDEVVVHSSLNSGSPGEPAAASDSGATPDQFFGPVNVLRDGSVFISMLTSLDNGGAHTNTDTTADIEIVSGLPGMTRTQSLGFIVSKNNCIGARLTKGDIAGTENYYIVGQQLPSGFPISGLADAGWCRGLGSSFVGGSLLSVFAVHTLGESYSDANPSDGHDTQVFVSSGDEYIDIAVIDDSDLDTWNQVCGVMSDGRFLYVACKGEWGTSDIVIYKISEGLEIVDSYETGIEVAESGHIFQTAMHIGLYEEGSGNVYYIDKGYGSAQLGFEVYSDPSGNRMSARDLPQSVFPQP